MKRASQPLDISWLKPNMPAADLTSEDPEHGKDP